MALYDIKCISSRSGAGDMMRKILSSLAVLSCFLLLANALPSEMMEERSLDLLGDFSDEMQKEIDADNSLDDANVTGAWSIDLMGERREKMKLYLLQNGSLISGQGVIIQGDETVKATASGSISGLEMNLDRGARGCAGSIPAQSDFILSGGRAVRRPSGRWRQPVGQIHICGLGRYFQDCICRG